MTQSKAEELEKQAREKMREIYRNSGHKFSDADIEKLCNDAEEEIKQWASFAAQVLEQSIAEVIELVAVEIGRGTAVLLRELLAAPPSTSQGQDTEQEER